MTNGLLNKKKHDFCDKHTHFKYKCKDCVLARREYNQLNPSKSLANLNDIITSGDFKPRSESKDNA